MRIVAIADMHGHLPEIPEADVLVIAGDACGCRRDLQAIWFNEVFNPWLKEVPVACKIFVPGNHDEVFYYTPGLVKPRCHCLIDDAITIDNVVFYGSPWCKAYGGWAFEKHDMQLCRYWDNIPDDTDVLITHTPPYGVLDSLPWEIDNFRGSGSLMSRLILWPTKDRIHFFGHIHLGYGVDVHSDVPGTKFYNVALCDDMNNPVPSRKPVEVDYP